MNIRLLETFLIEINELYKFDATFKEMLELKL
jgi:hypothetical protein